MTQGRSDASGLLKSHLDVSTGSKSRAPASANSPRSGASPNGIASPNTVDDQCINTIRTLAMDAVQQAMSGHPGTPMALAPAVFTLWQNFLHFDPDDPIWPN